MMTEGERQTMVEALAEAIRECSREGNAAGSDRLFAALEAAGLPGVASISEAEREDLLSETLAAHNDLAAMESLSGQTLYHAPALLSRTYAAILDRRSSPTVLIAEEVRRNSAEYPRPLPLDLFEAPPFELTPVQIESALKEMASHLDFCDITYTTTSTGAVYLFSTRHLERPFAEFLAERAETGLSLNP